MKSTPPNGAILYRGPSMIDGKPIIAIVTGLADSSANSKTGAMLQTWILREDIAPHEALKTGDDASVCGECPLRPVHRNACYVKVYQAPLSIYRAYHRGAYGSEPMEDLPALGQGRVVRVGSYGDPAAVPAVIWWRLIRHAKGWTGYTHQHGAQGGPLAINVQALRPLVMASVETVPDMHSARGNGWRTFRVAPVGNKEQDASERVCPASKEAGFKTDCASCRACSGMAGRGHSSIVIQAHGVKARRVHREAVAHG